MKNTDLLKYSKQKKDNKLKSHCKKWKLKHYNGTGLDEKVVNEIIGS